MNDNVGATTTLARSVLGDISRGVSELLRYECEFGETEWTRGPVSNVVGLAQEKPSISDRQGERGRSQQLESVDRGDFQLLTPENVKKTPPVQRQDGRSSTQIEPIRTDLFRNVPRGLDGLNVIREELGDCRRCKLHSGRTNLVFGVGNPNAELMFVGEGPGADEDIQGIPFVGKAGQLLTRQIAAMGYVREDVYIANIVKCRPPNNRDPEHDERLACGPYVLGQIRAVSPKVIVALGRVATQALLETTAPIGTLRGKWFTHPHIPVQIMPTYHPAALLRADNLRRYVWEDLKQVMAYLGKPIPGR